MRGIPLLPEHERPDVELAARPFCAFLVALALTACSGKAILVADGGPPLDSGETVLDVVVPPPMDASVIDAGPPPVSCADMCTHLAAAGCAPPSCSTDCESLGQECAASAANGLFQSFLHCMSTAAVACNGGAPEVPACASLTSSVSMACVPAEAGPPVDAGTPDAPTLSCYAGVAFTPPPWAPPTPLHQGACTAMELQTFGWCLQYNFCGGSGSPSCDACLQTDLGAAAYGPVVATQGNVIVELNVGGCVATFDGDMTATGCGAQLDVADACFRAECRQCTDFANPMVGGPTQHCSQEATGAGGACAPYAVSPTCAAETAPGGVAAACAGGLAPLVDVWCGP